jgi:hypothetical protein
MRVSDSCCPSVRLRCLVLSVLDLRSGLQEPHGWPANTAWAVDLIPHRVRERKAGLPHPFLLSLTLLPLCVFDFLQGMSSEDTAPLFLINPETQQRLRRQRGAVLGKYALVGGGDLAEAWGEVDSRIAPAAALGRRCV